jgi:hypothetical protein
MPIKLATFDSDPLTYVLGAMANLNDNEQLAIELIVEPRIVKQVKSLSRSVLYNGNVLKNYSKTNLLNFINKLIFGLIRIISELFYDIFYGTNNVSINDNFEKQVSDHKRPARVISSFEQKVMELINQKLNEPLFNVDLRILSSSDSKKRTDSIRAAFGSYSLQNYQSFLVKRHFPFYNQQKTFSMSLIPSLSPMVLSSSEVASLYHFPTSLVDNTISSLSHTLVAPTSLKDGSKLDVILGENIHHGVVTPIGLTTEERRRHVYIVGGTGNGKTTMLKYSIIQDIKNGHGVGVIDPHGDLAEDLLNYIPKERINDVIYLNPDDLSYPIGINLLELDKNLDKDDLLRQKDFVTESVVSLMRKVFSNDGSGGHRIEYILRNTVQTALTLENCNLFTVFYLLNDSRFRYSVVNNLKDEDLKMFWKNEVGKAGSMQRIKMSIGITAKIGRFLFSEPARRILEQTKSTIDFSDIINNHKILICNFSKGNLGEDVSSLFGTTILAKLQLAILSRSRQSENSRCPFYLYVDEFQNFATIEFSQMLSESRKYGLLLTMAEQSLAQQSNQNITDIIMANVGTLVCFRTGSPKDEEILMPLFRPFLNAGEIINQEAYNFYLKTVTIKAKEPMSGRTILIDKKTNKKLVNLVKENSRKHWAKRFIKHPGLIIKVSKANEGDPIARIKKVK